VPDTLNAILQYPEGFTVNLSATFNNQSASERSIEILGTKGTLAIGRDLTFTPENPIEDNGWIVDSWPSALEEAYYNDPKIIQSEQPQKWDPKIIPGAEHWSGVGRNTTVLHFEQFQRSVKDRKQPPEDVFAGHRAAAVAHMINMSAARKKPVYWDRSRDGIKA
jgi:predicted dehydrogenase